ncbi:hypothetical protein GCM10022197_04000 [Microlunatus spumicola]|uniref:PH domain-containing protein n=1 Tax=Microlunatus spumicola TaxID=81499 RepID=A0ABP6WKZ9_9ACTN
MADDESLELRAAWVPLRPWTLVALPVVLLGLSSLVSGRLVLLLVAVAGLVLGLVVQLLFSWSRNRQGPVMVLDRAGLEVRGHPRVSWADVEKVVVSTFQVRGSRALSWLTTLQNGVVVSFVPRPGVRMPPPPGGLKHELSSWESVRQARYGTNLTVVPSFFNASARRIARAAHHLGSIPVQDDTKQ